MRGISAGKIAIEALDLITIAVPPALPAAMTVGRFYAQKRLETNNIYCISPRSINVSGSIDCVCFDKTGTLTEDGLDMWGVVPKSGANTFQIPMRHVQRLPYDHFLFGMVTCHSITIMAGERKGDPLDLKMFESTGWLLEEANVADDTKYDLLFPTMVRPPRQSGFMISDADTGDGAFGSHMDIGIVREFSFTSSLQRMAVVTRKLLAPAFHVYCKGSPEMIETLCRPETVPGDFHATLEEYAQQGYRVIALAHKALDKKITYPKVQRIARERIECDLEFLGLVVLENRLKADTETIIGGLMAANIRTVMVTGDNMLTALSVARDCGMVPKGQSVITVNARPTGKVTATVERLPPAAADDADSEWELYYTLTGTATCGASRHAGGGGGGGGHFAATPNGYGGDYALMTNSNSVASLDTVDTFTHHSGHPAAATATASGGATVHQRRHDVEAGFGGAGQRRDHDEEPAAYGNDHDDDDDPLRLAPELPCNNYRFAMTGRTWQILRDDFAELLPRFVTRGTIFARMSPDQKQALVLELQSLGYYVAMCGDGANDCGALKAAHTGISLSEAESSVASPFTSRNPTIACVPTVIREGRAALVTSVGIFKYMAAYSLVQFASVLILYSIDSNLTDIQFLYIDLFIISVFAFFFGKTESYEGPLVRQTPLSSLVSLSPIASLAMHLVLAVGVQVVGYVHLQQQPWFVPFRFEAEEHLGCYENYTVFAISCFQYIILAFVFSKGKPYRKGIYTNYGFLATILVNVAVAVYLTLQPEQNAIAAFFELVMPPDFTFRAYVLMYGVLNLVLSLFIEMFVIDHLFFRRLRYRFHNIEKSRRKFLAVENGMRLEPAWPPLSLYQNVVTSGSVDGALDAAAKALEGQFAEISVETGGMDAGPLFVEKETSVLNSFFALDGGTDDSDSGSEQEFGALEPIDEVDSSGGGDGVAPAASPEDSGAEADSGNDNGRSSNNDGGQLPNGQQPAVKHTTKLSIQLANGDAAPVVVVVADNRGGKAANGQPHSGETVAPVGNGGGGGNNNGS